MLKTIGNIIYDYYQFFILPFLSISIFYAMEYMSRDVEFFVNQNGVKWRFLSFSAMFKSDALQEYQTLQLVAIILLGTTPFNISILIWVAIKLEIYRLMRNRYEKEFKQLINTNSLLQEALTGTQNKDDFTSSQHDEEQQTHENTEQETIKQNKSTQDNLTTQETTNQTQSINKKKSD
ncbi:MAG: hypothetical protein SPJ16_09885 [Helicobacter sp.]|uniref:hypothetical protein n=1 Tax=Helicobacter sp. TaxID=218 RepID=UPI002A913161|nr:hypothetical protein [Helicobacter sp.]MDY5951485.1 hypothetical protein [Helicobacter sp.]